ncbi:hypothetical protein UlMin_040491 [Ulmus minor]
MAPISLFLLFILTHLLLLSSANDETYHPRCPGFLCGRSHLQFPFYNITNPDCGLYAVDCEEQTPKIQFTKGGHPFKTEFISPLQDTVKINDGELERSLDLCKFEDIERFALPCPSVISNVSAPNLSTLFKCNRSLAIQAPEGFINISCKDYDIYYSERSDIYYSKVLQPECSMIQIPPIHHDLPGNHAINFPIRFDLEVNVNFDCLSCFNFKGGLCKTDINNQLVCKDARKENKHFGLKLGLGLGIPLVLVCFFLILFLVRRYKRKHASSDLRNTSDPCVNSDPEGGNVYFGVPVFSYKDLEVATNNFDAEKVLGDGGFGTVYHGKLKDGREIAVKRLYEHNYKRVKQFMNEIEILTRLRHKNLVSLYGCTSHHCRELLLVYEYIPNGTVADHLHGDQSKTTPLSWPIRMSIAIETANALFYLHASDIVHRDVKTNNILLDNHFCVKVADFGLSRLFPTDVTHVSTAPQGTPGYVDPEYRQCYQLTSKSDVYSFGVVLVELLSSMPAVDITRHRHEINLSNLAISKIQKCAYHELIDPLLGFDSVIEVKRMTIAVAELAFQCLQQDKEMRPSMEKVLEELTRIERGENDTADQEKASDGAGLTVQQSPSANFDEIGLLKNMKQQPPPPIAVTEKWLSSRSSTPNISG